MDYQAASELEGVPLWEVREHVTEGDWVLGTTNFPNRRGLYTFIPKAREDYKDIVAVMVNILLKDPDYSDELDFERIVRGWLEYKLGDKQEREQVGDLVSLFSGEGNVNTPQKGRLFKVFYRIRVSVNPSELDCPYICRLLTCDFNSREVEFIQQVLDPELYHLLFGYINLPNIKLLTTAFGNIETLFPMQTTEYDINSLRQVLTKAETMDNLPVVGFIKYLLGEQSNKEEKPYAEIPTWIIDSEYRYLPHNKLVKLIPKLLEIEYAETKFLENLDIPPERWVSVSIEEDARFIANLHCVDYDIPFIETQYVDVFSRMEKQERETLINTVLDSSRLMYLKKSRVLFRILGPSNPETTPIELKLESDDPCLLYGGHRSHTCYEEENVIPENGEPRFENPVQDDQLGELDWYNGRCDECGLYIRRKCHGMRMPLSQGRWVGCYCSSHCMEEEVTRNMGEYRADAELRLNQIWIFEGQYREMNVYDCQDSDEETDSDD